MRQPSCAAARNPPKVRADTLTIRPPRFMANPGIPIDRRSTAKRFKKIDSRTSVRNYFRITIASLGLYFLALAGQPAYAFERTQNDRVSTSTLTQDQQVEQAIEQVTPPWFNAQTGQMRPINEFSRSVDLYDTTESADRQKAAYYFNWWDLSIRPAFDLLYDWLIGWWWPTSWSWAEYWPYILLTITVIAILAIAIYWIMQMEKIQVLMGRGGKKGTLKRRKNATVADLPFELEGITLSVDDLLARAKGERQAGNSRMAIVYLFSHLLLVLDRKEFILLTKGKTNRTYLWELKEHRQVRPFFRQIMTAFEQVFFGQYQLTESEVETLFQEAESLGLQ